MLESLACSMVQDDGICLGEDLGRNKSTTLAVYRTGEKVKTVVLHVNNHQRQTLVNDFNKLIE